VTLFTLRDRIKTERIHDGHIINLRIDTLQVEDGTTVLREVIEHNGGVVIAAQTAEHELLFVQQYRYSLDQTIIELPAGRIEKGEDPFLAAQRELIEETGFRASQWRTLTSLYSAPGFCDEVLHLYHASDLAFEGKKLDMDEETDVVKLSVDEAWSMVESGAIRDAKTVAGIAFCRLFNSPDPDSHP